MAHSWIVVADASRARIFSSNGNLSEMQEVETLTHPAGRLHEQELTSDLPGRAFDSTGHARHAMGQPVDPKKQEEIVFAKQIADHLDEERKQKTFEHLILIAPPAMLGFLRDSLSAETRKRVTEEIHKDLTQHTLADIKQHLPQHLPA